MPDNIFRNVVSWVADRSGANQTVAVNKVVGGSINEIAAASNKAYQARVRELELSRQSGGALAAEVAAGNAAYAQRVAELNAVNAAQQQQKRSVQDLTLLYDALEQQEKEAAAAAASAANAGDVRGRIGGSGSSGIATGFGGSLRSVGAAVGNLGGGQSVTQAASLIGLAELGPAAVVVGAFALGLKLVTENAKQAAEAVAATAKAYQDVREAALTSTREELELERDRAQELIQIRQQAADEAQAAFREAERNAAPIALLLNTDAFVEGLEATRDQTKTALTDVQNELLALNLVLLEGGGAAASAAEAEKRLTEARAQYAVDEADILIRLRTTTAEERRERVAAIEDEIAILRRRADEEGKGSAAGAVFEARIISLGQELELTANSAKTYGDALEKIRKKEEATAARVEALTERNQQYLDALDREATARDKAADISAKIAELAEGRDARLLELQADYEDRRTEVVSEGEERRLESAKDAADRLAKIERDFGRSRQEAVGGRDANALRLARIRATDAAADAKEGVDKQAEAAQKAQAKQLISLDKGYEKQVQSTITAANKQISVQQAALAEQLFLAQQARDNQVFLTQSGMSQMVNTVATGWQQITILTNQAFNNMSANRLVGGGGSSGFPQVQGYGVFNPMTERQVADIATKQYIKIKTAARGGRGLIA